MTIRKWLFPIILLISGWITLRMLPDGAGRKTSLGENPPAPPSTRSSSAGRPPDIARHDGRSRNERAGAETLKSAEELKEELGAVFLAAEENRSRPLTRYELEDRIIYLVAVEPPSPEEIGAMRKQVAEFQRNCPPDEKERFDQLLGKLIKEYDPFGVDGRKAFHIWATGSQIGGFVFPVDDIDEMVEKIHPKSGQTYRIRATIGYHGSDGRAPTRFRKFVE